MAQAVALGEQRVHDALLPFGQTEIPAFVGDFAQELLRSKQRPVQDPAAFSSYQVRTKIRNSLGRRRRLIAHDRYSALPCAHIALQAYLQARVRRDDDVEVALHLKAASAALLLSVEPIAAHQTLEDGRTFGAQEIRLHVHADQQRLLQVAE